MRPPRGRAGQNHPLPWVVLTAPASHPSERRCRMAFGLPAFVILFVVFYWMPPLIQTNGNRKSPLWQLLICAAAIAALWGWVGPGAVK